jgi:hypothetical protein
MLDFITAPSPIMEPAPQVTTEERTPRRRDVEIKFRKKGEVITLSFPCTTIPPALRVPEDKDGVDLTGYPVIHAAFGRRGGGEKARELHARAPNTIVVYTIGRMAGGKAFFCPYPSTRSACAFSKARKKRMSAPHNALPRPADPDITL